MEMASFLRMSETDKDSAPCVRYELRPRGFYNGNCGTCYVGGNAPVAATWSLCPHGLDFVFRASCTLEYCYYKEKG